MKTLYERRTQQMGGEWQWAKLGEKRVIWGLKGKGVSGRPREASIK